MTLREEKIEEILKGLGFTFFEDGILKDTYISKTDILELLDTVWNLAIEHAANNADADFMCLVGEDEEKIRGMFAKGNLEVYVLKNSILKLKV